MSENSGLEQTMDEVLQGTKGEISYYTDNVGKRNGYGKQKMIPEQEMMYI